MWSGKLKLESRTSKSIVNISASLINKILKLVLQFVVRTIFIYFLGKEYLGINGLFASIISLLSLADLGFGVALPFSLYKPLAENDEEKIKSIMGLYSKVYRIIGISVLGIGCSITPFLQSIIKDMPDIPNIIYIYILFVLNSAVSYFFTYKRSLIIADQKGYIVTFIESIFTILLTIAQIIVIVVFKNYILYLCMGIISTVLQNIYISYKCNRIYPFLNNRNFTKLKKEEKKQLSKNIGALFIYKLAMVIETGTDNIVISTFLGIAYVGLYSNYLLIIDSIKNVLMLAVNSLTASIGNVIASEDNEKSYLLFKAIDMICIICYGISSIAICILINPFINLWIGKEYLLDSYVVLALGINFYIFGSQNTTSSFRNAYGLFWQGRYRPIVMILSNLFLSIILVQYVGLVGVFIGTIISRLISVGVMDYYVVHKYGFKKSVMPYILKKVMYFFVVCIIGLLSYIIASFIKGNTLIFLILKAICICISSLILFLLFFRKKEEFKYVMSLIYKGLKK